MDTSEPAKRLAATGDKQPLAEYNFRHFLAKHLIEDAQRTFVGHGVAPGETAPDFALPEAGGGTLRLSDLRGRPVLLHFGSFT